MEETTEIFTQYNEITCPYCEENQGMEAEDLTDLVSIWGEDEAVKWECRYCKKSFYIKEVVRRYWETSKKEKSLY